MENLFSVNKKSSFYKHINESLYFSAMKYKPESVNDMYDFIFLHNGHNFFEKKHIQLACVFSSMKTIQLDAFFILARCMDYFYRKITDDIVIFVGEAFRTLDNLPNELLKITHDEKFLRDFSEDLMEYMRSDITLDKFIYVVVNSLEGMFDTQPYLNPININESDNQLKNNMSKYFLEYAPKLNKFIKTIYDKTISELNKILPIGNIILQLCGKKNIVEGEEKILAEFIKSNIQLVPNFTTDNIILDYYEHIFNLYNIDTSNQQHSSQNIKQQINSKLITIGYEMYDIQKNLWFHSILDCFVECGFAKDNKEISIAIYHILFTEKNTIGYVNKYEYMSLFDYFVLVSIANDISSSYEKFMKEIGATYRIPFDYPMEIIMRILSRLYNVTIIFYTNKLTCMVIDNCLEINSNNIAIYQYSPDAFYTITPIGSPVNIIEVGINETNKLGQYKPINDIADIVEI
jgi:hypothetical protein